MIFQHIAAHNKHVCVPLYQTDLGMPLNIAPQKPQNIESPIPQA